MKWPFMLRSTHEKEMNEIRSYYSAELRAARDYYAAELVRREQQAAKETTLVKQMNAARYGVSAHD